jgi:murein DD-endopeptidase
MSLWLGVAACRGTGMPPPQPAPLPLPATSTPVATPPVAQAPTLEGTWRGVLGGALHLVLTITRAGDGFHGVLESVDQGATLPIDVLTVDASSVRFEIHRVGGNFQGAVDAATGQLRGSWTQQGTPQPLAFTKGNTAVDTATREPPPKPLDAPIDVVVPEPPAVLRADGKTHLVYELHVTNFSLRRVTLQRIDVEAHGAPLAHLEGADLTSASAHPGVAQGAGLERLEIGPGLRAVVYLWVTIDQGPAPSSLDHRITLRMADSPDEMTVSNVRTPVRAGQPPVFAPPLRGGSWRAANGPSNDSGHRRALIPIGGRAHIAQRFAIDWVKVGDDGKTFQGDGTKNESYLAYGAEALAVADGVVTEAKDGIPQNVPGSNRALPIDLETVGGNHVIVDLGGGYFGFWAHLQPGSLRVKVGDHVKRGRVLGLVGNSGNSTEPHLHFHVTDASSPLGSEGVPYALDAFELRVPGQPVAFP